MPEAVEFRGYCGIQLKNYEHFNVGGNQSFLRLANGIIGLNSTGNISNMSFDDMNSVDQSPVYVKEGFGIHLLGKGGSYWFNINETYTSMTFNNCKTGVFAKSYAGRVAGTTMTNVGTGIEWLQSNNRDMFFRENDISARRFGIRTFFNEPVHSYSIMENNNITITEGLADGNNAVGAIVMDEIGLGSDPYGPIPVTTTADGWEVKGSTITMEKGGNGILYRNGVNGIVNTNNVKNESEPNDYKGIFTAGSYFIGVSNNTIFQDNSAGLGTAFGIYSAGGQANTFQCNCIDKTNVGMQFFDMADFPNAVRGNNFNKHCTGLQLGFDGVGGTIIGDQVHAGNLWDLSAISGSCLGARNHGSIIDISQSEFFSNCTTNASFCPAVFPNLGWFSNDEGQSNVSCSSCSFPTNIPTRLTETNTPTAFDFDVASGNYTTGNYTNEMLWKARYRLYRKLLRRPAVESSDSVFTTFKSGYQNSSFAKLATIAEQKAQLFNLTEVQDSVLENRRLAYKFYDNDLRILDSLVQAGATVSETTYNNTKGFAASAQGSYETYAETLRILVNQKIQSLDSLNDLVSAVLTPDANHKTVNAIVFHFLQTDSIAAGDMRLLENIATQCPLEGGDAVYEARAVVGYFTGAQYDDEGACNVQPRENLEKNVQIATDFIKVYPNPTTGELRWEGLDESIASVRIFNTLGQLQLQQPATYQWINLTGLVEGLYWVQFLDVESKTLATKTVQLIRN